MYQTMKKTNKGIRFGAALACVAMVVSGVAVGAYAVAAKTAGTYIGEEKAKSIALTHAGLEASQVTFAQAFLERDDGRWEYDVEFYTGNYEEYDYEIDAYTGTVLSFDYDMESERKPAVGNAAQSASTAGYIGEARAKEIALGRAGVTAGSAYGMRCEMDHDDGRVEYQVEFMAGGYEYEVEIDATTGAILDYDRDRD